MHLSGSTKRLHLGDRALVGGTGWMGRRERRGRRISKVKKEEAMKGGDKYK